MFLDPPLFSTQYVLTLHGIFKSVLLICQVFVLNPRHFASPSDDLFDFGLNQWFLTFFLVRTPLKSPSSSRAPF